MVSSNYHINRMQQAFRPVLRNCWLAMLSAGAIFSSPSYAQSVWEPVDGATVESSRQVYVRGAGYYTDNTVSGVSSENVSESLRLVVDNNTHTVTNADGTDESGRAYFTLSDIGASVRMYFAAKRGTFAYDAQLYQLVETVEDADDDGIPDSEDICPTDASNDCVQISGMVFGGGSAVGNAQVTVGTNTVTDDTDLAGTFTVNVGPLELSSEGAQRFFPVHVDAPGFASGYAKVAYVDDVLEYDVTVTLKQISDSITQEDDITEGVDITDGGINVGQITIPQTALPEGVTEVTGDITYLDPASDDILATPGGDLLALPEGSDPNTDEPVTLETFGMMEFDLQDQDGNDISELDGMAEVCMKATPGLALGDTIPLWYFDEAKGLWVEEGEGTVVDRDGELMICGEVSHFSWWNYDRPITTHSVLHFEVEAENVDFPLDDVVWHAEGNTYSGTSPARHCSDSGSDFNAFTVKISTTNNQESVKVFALLGGAKFYLRSDGDGTYSLTQDEQLAEVFDTPTTQGSCLSGVLSGEATPLDYADNADGVLPLDTEINLPPIITDFYLSDVTLFLGESADLQAMIVDPEGTQVSAEWAADCNYFGNEDISLTINAVNSDDPDVFKAQLTTPESIDYPLASCELTVTATDEDGVQGKASRWIVVSSSFKFQLEGTVYGTDGLPMINESVQFRNWWCNENEGIDREVITDGEGNFSTFVDLSSCGLNQYGYFDVGYFYLDYQYDGVTWLYQRPVNRYSDLRTSRCMIDESAVTHCELDMYLPTVWGPVSATYLPPEGETFEFLYVNLWNFPSNGNNGYNYLAEEMMFSEDMLTINDIMMPLGRNEVSVSGFDDWYYSPFHLSSRDGTSVDVGDASIPLTITILDPQTGEAFSNRTIQLEQWNNSDATELELVTDENGQASTSVSLGWVNLQWEYEINGNIYTYYEDATVNQVVDVYYKDISTPQMCTVQGTLLDRFGQPMTNAALELYTSSFFFGDWFEVTTDAAGRFEIDVTAGQLWLESVNQSDNSLGYWNQYLQIDNCRAENGVPKTIKWEFFGDRAFITPRRN